MAAVKYDLCKSAEQGKTMRKAFYRPNMYFGETFFVPRPGGPREDDGVVLVPGADGAQKRLSLFVLDAATMEVVAEAPLPEGTGGYTTRQAR